MDSSEAPAKKPLEEMTREELQREWARLDAEEPGFAGPIALTAVGAALAIVGVVFAIYGVTFTLLSNVGGSGVSSSVGTILLVVAGVLLAGGITMAVLGGFAVRDAVYDRRERNKQLKKIRDLLDGGQPMPFDRPPLPPPPPTSVQHLPPLPVLQLVVASW